MGKFFSVFLAACICGFCNENTESGYNESFVSLVEHLYGKGYLSQGGTSSLYSQFQGVALEGKRLLDIGCGLGGPDIDLARTHDVHIIGIDPEEFLVKEAEKNAFAVKDQLTGTLSFQVTKNPFSLAQFPSESFDIVSSRETLLHIPTSFKLPFLKEMARVLTSKGKLILVDWIKHAPFSEKTLKMMKMDGVAFI
jgi:phosphoethanolamine N-methyltransferase